MTLHYQERPPYSQTASDGSVNGLVATPATRALQQAGIEYQWALTPSQRQLALIQSGRGPHCGIGWFQTTERAAQGKFSRALYRDQPFGALARPEAPLTDRMRATDALAGASGSLLIKEGYSYGPLLDSLLARARTPPLRTSSEVTQIARMVVAGRAAWMIVTPEEAQWLLEDPQIREGGLRLIRFSDMPPGATRHLYCSHAVPDAVIARIDRALASVPAR